MALSDQLQAAVHLAGWRPRPFELSIRPVHDEERHVGLVSILWRLHLEPQNVAVELHTGERDFGAASARQDGAAQLIRVRVEYEIDAVMRDVRFIRCEIQQMPLADDRFRRVTGS